MENKLERPSRIKRILKNEIFGIFIILILMCIALTILGIPMSRLALDRGYEAGAVHRGLELLDITGYTSTTPWRISSRA